MGHRSSHSSHSVPQWQIDRFASDGPLKVGFHALSVTFSTLKVTEVFPDGLGGTPFAVPSGWAPRSAAGDFLLWTWCYAPVLYQVKERLHLLFLGKPFRVARPKSENEVCSPKLPLLCSFRVGAMCLVGVGQLPLCF